MNQDKVRVRHRIDSGDIYQIVICFKNRKFGLLATKLET